jgi:O-antigen/teichoic acid export membrane protein
MKNAADIQSDLKKLVSGTALAFGGTVIGNGVVYLLGVVMGRFLGAEVVGLYFMGLVIMQIAAAVSRMGMAESILRFVPVYVSSQDYGKARGTILLAVMIGGALSVLTAGILFFLSPWLSMHFVKNMNLSYYIRWFALALPLFTVGVLLFNAIQSLKRMDLVVIARDLVQPLTLLGLALIFFRFHPKPVSFLSAHFFSVVLALLVALFFLKRSAMHVEEAKSNEFPWKSLMVFSIPIGCSDMAYYLFRWSDTFLLSYFRSAAEVGVYNAALRTTLILNLLAASCTALYAPIIAEHYHHGRKQEVQMILCTMIRWCLSLTIPIVFVMAFLSKDILSLWGPEFVEGSNALIILGLCQLISIPTILLSFTLLMCGKQVIEFGNVIAVTAVNITMNLFFIPRYGINGAAVSMLASQLIAVAVRLGELRSILAVQPYSPKYFKPVLACVPIFLLFVLLQSYMTKIAVTVSLGSQIGAMGVLCILIVGGYYLTLSFLGFEDEDLVLWQEIRNRRSAETCAESCG